MRYLEEKSFVEEKGIAHQIEILREAKDYYIKMFGQKLTQIPEKIQRAPNFLDITVEQMIRAIKIFNIPKNRVDLFWAAKFYYLLPLPPDWAEIWQNLEKKVFKYMKKEEIDFHPGVLYIEEILNPLLKKEIKMKKAQYTSRPTDLIPAIGTGIHAYKANDGRIIKIDLQKRLKRLERGDVIYPEQRKKTLTSSSWWKKRPDIKLNTIKSEKRLLEFKSRIPLSLKGRPADKIILFQEKQSLKEKMNGYISSKGRIQSRMINKIEESYFNSKPEPRQYKTREDISGNIFRIQKKDKKTFGRNIQSKSYTNFFKDRRLMSEMDCQFHYTIKNSIVDYPLTGDAKGIEREVRRGQIRNMAEEIKTQSKIAASQNLEQEEFEKEYENSMPFNNQNEISGENFRIDYNASIIQPRFETEKTELAQDEEEDPFAKFDKKKICENYLRTTSNFNKTSFIVNGKIKVKKSNTQNLFSKTSAGKFFEEENSQLRSMYKDRILRERSKIAKSEITQEEIKRLSPNKVISTYYKKMQKPDRRKLISRYYSKRCLRDSQREILEMKRVKTSLSRKNVNISMKMLRRSLMTPESNKRVSIHSKGMLPGASDGLQSYEDGDGKERKKKKKKKKN